MPERLHGADAWILHAILMSAKPGEYVSLADIIATADYTNHAIPTLGEMDSALYKLLEAGWIEQAELTFSPTQQADDMYAPQRAGSGSVHKALDFVEQELGVLGWPAKLPPEPDKCKVVGLNRRVFDDAYREYTRSIK